MKIVSTSYSSETKKMPAQEVDLYRAFAGATTNSGIEQESWNVPSLSMDDFPGELPAIVYRPGSDQVAELRPEAILFWRKGLEWTGLYSVTRIPENVQQQLQTLRESEQEDALYKVAESISRWMLDASGGEQSVFATYIADLPVKGVQVLLAALADAEVHLISERLLHTVAGFLGSVEKRLAQAAAICLLQCGGGMGGTLLRTRLNNSTSLPHVQLILGAVNLLTQHDHVQA